MKNNLRLSREKIGLTQPLVVHHLRTKEPRVDVSLYSKMETGVCLPTNDQLAALEALYGLRRTELYDPQDLDLLNLELIEADAEDKPAGRKQDTRSATYYRKCYRISRAFEESLPADLLSVCGYTSWQSFHDAALKRLLGEYAARVRAKKKGD